jgi:mono/diheme cytochrome c family protein
VGKRTWIVMIAMLALGVILSACGGGDLAKDLTPIPTLPPGDEPALIDALPGGAATTGGEMGDAEVVALGEQVFTATCSGCHGAEDEAGPPLTGMGERAAERVAGQSAEEYLHESIVDPGAYVVEGFSNIMPPNFAQQLSEEQINGLIAYILAESGGAAGEPGGEPTAESQPESPAETPEATSEAVTGDPQAGEQLFAANCAMCHGETDGVGPARVGMGERAAERVAGQSAEEYLHESIVDPGAYVVEGFSNIMPPNSGEKFSDEELQDLIAYMLTQ